jgi:YggT family protein
LITALFQLLFLLIRLYVWALILAAVFSMLVSFGVLDSRNRLVWTVGDFLFRVTEPVLRPIRNRLPNLGGIDLSPLVVILGLEFLVQPLLRALYSGIAYGVWTPLFF